MLHRDLKPQNLLINREGVLPAFAVAATKKKRTGSYLMRGRFKSLTFLITNNSHNSESGMHKQTAISSSCARFTQIFFVERTDCWWTGRCEALIFSKSFLNGLRGVEDRGLWPCARVRHPRAFVYARSRHALVPERGSSQ